MDLETLKDTPRCDRPEGTANRLLEILRNRAASRTERKLAAELAGDYTIIDDKIGSALLSIVRSSGETQGMRATAAIALGPALEHADSVGFEDPDDILLSEQVIRDIQQSLRKLYQDEDIADAAFEALAMAEGAFAFEDDGDELAH